MAAMFLKFSLIIKLVDKFSCVGGQKEIDCKFPSHELKYTGFHYLFGRFPGNDPIIKFNNAVISLFVCNGLSLSTVLIAFILFFLWGGYVAV